MAFHVACPITCRRICFCALGFPRRLQSEKGRGDFLQEVHAIDRFLSDPWLIKARENATVQVQVPKVAVKSPASLPPRLQFGGEEAEAPAASAQLKRVKLQKQGAAASIVGEDYSRRFGSGDLVVSAKDAEQGHSNSKVVCQLCFSGENEGSERARKMLSCKSCGKKYHRSCLKAWSRNRDLFHWSSWTCPSCRICEVCQKTGDPNKFMFCKRCDGALHCYCQQPPHKNVGYGPYLCPKHTNCHSCGSSVPGNGLSVRWFLGYTCCDACGRLFVKGNYCPVCLKVYRDSESTPMVCCDICQHWVHCPCDGISDAKYMQFQVDGNLQYACPACRGESCQVKNPEEAVQELWKRRDEADRDLIASLRADAGLPTQEEIFDISPFSDDEESDPASRKNEYNRSLKFSLKGRDEKSPRSKEYGKKSSKKKYGKKKGNEISFTNGTNTENFGRHTDGQPFGYKSSDNKNEKIQFSEEHATSSSGAGILSEAISEAAISNHKHVDEVIVAAGTKTSRTIKIKNNKPQSLTNSEDSPSGMLKTGQGPKLVIHLGGRNRNANSPPTSEASSLKKGRYSNVGTEDASQLKYNESIERASTTTTYGDTKDHKMNHAGQIKSSKLQEKEGPLIKLKNVNSESSNISLKHAGGFSKAFESDNPQGAHSLLGNRTTEDGASARRGPEFPGTRRNKHSSIKSGDDVPTMSSELVEVEENSSFPPMSQASSEGHKPHLIFRIPKNSNTGNQNDQGNMSNADSLRLSGKGDITYTRGQRSKRRRPALGDGDTSQQHEDNTIKEFTDANWILQKLGKNAAGKRIEIHQSSNDSWHSGTAVDIFEAEGESIVAVSLDDGKTKNFELGKQGIRFVSQKQKH
ncbi:uncharacterized protein LOC121809496 isoform X2 [Salvia splendens]|uniref:uncharacterized protein LOC121809496 isoform X2 n=1 Tax=Salvia splendens TaxID=180675 RepID=UPI001C265789|nr:uncharacterized protein LOC121809496 isoform X2 [Salvia splendens]